MLRRLILAACNAIRSGDFWPFWGGEEDLLIHGDSVYDIIDKQDHGAIQSELSRGVSQHSGGTHHSHHSHLHHHHHLNHQQHNNNHHNHHHHSQQHQQQQQPQHQHAHHHLHVHHHGHGSALSPSGSSVAGTSSSAGGSSAGSSLMDGEQRIFLCRMNVSRNARRQMRFGDQKVGEIICRTYRPPKCS
uniref:Uncharacterized protein n=1 Tax=Anopheles atroparvus TaxID=41427 RepID=A0A182JB57_ANOAO